MKPASGKALFLASPRVRVLQRQARLASWWWWWAWWAWWWDGMGHGSTRRRRRRQGAVALQSANPQGYLRRRTYAAGWLRPLVLSPSQSTVFRPASHHHLLHHYCHATETAAGGRERDGLRGRRANGRTPTRCLCVLQRDSGPAVLFYPDVPGWLSWMPR